MTDATLPVTVVGGYLGAGKTTLINHLLRHADGVRLAVLVNDFGELPIDADLIESRDENVISITGGCMCCAYGSDLIAALRDIDGMAVPPDHLLIETSGVGLPDAIAQSVTLIQRFTVDGIVVLADAETVLERGTDKYLADTVVHQVAAADIVLLNKIDLTDGEMVARTKEWLSQTAPEARIIEAVDAVLPLATLLGSGLETTAAFDEKAHHHASHEAGVFSVTGSVDPDALAAFLASGALDLVRSKGFVHSNDGGYWSLQTVGRRWSTGMVTGARDAVGRIVCITHRPPIDRAVIDGFLHDAYLEAEQDAKAR